MFERELLAEEFEAILECKCQASQRLAALLVDLRDDELREQVSQLQANLSRHVQLSERLVEIVS